MTKGVDAVRLFIAVSLPEAVRDVLAAEAASVRDMTGGRSAPPESFHLTLAFLGETAEERLGEVRAAMEECPSPPLELTVGGWGRFRQRGGDVLWREVRGGNALYSLQRRLVRALGKRAFTVDKKEYVPHITFVRKAVFPEGFAVLPEAEELSFPADGMWLMRSETGRGGPKYTGLIFVPFSRESE